MRGLYIFLLTCLVAATVHAAGPITYIDIFSGDQAGGATAVNDAGVVVGVSFINQIPPGSAVYIPHAFRWTAATGVQRIFADGSTSEASAINAAGEIAGSGPGGGFHYLPPGSPQTITNAGEATGINDSGIIVGYVPQAGVTQHAYRYDGVNTPQDLGVLGGTQSYAHDINNAGAIIGWSNNGINSFKKAFKYTGAGPMTAIPGMSNLFNSEAKAINNNGDIVGYMNGSGSIGTPFLYTAAGSLVTLTGATAGTASDINDAGYIVGTNNNATRAALWRPNNTLVDLDAWLDANFPADGANWTLTNALGINNNGLIVGVGQYLGAQRGYVLDASTLVPEPSAVLATLGLIPLALRRRR